MTAVEARYTEASEACGFVHADGKFWAPRDSKMWVGDDNTKKWAEDLIKGYHKVREINAGGSMVDVGATFNGVKVNPEPGEVASMGAGMFGIGMDTYNNEQQCQCTSRPHIFVRAEMLNAAHDAVVALQTKDIKTVVIAGSPGSGKTTSGSAAALAELVNSGEQVLRVSGKTEEVRLVRRNPFNGEIEAWLLTDDDMANEWYRLPVTRLKHVVAVYDPPELEKGVSPLVLRHVHCRLLMVPSDNTTHWGGDSEKFTGKDDRNVLMYVDPPTEREAIAMTLQLWDKKPMQLGAEEDMTVAQKVEEIERRIGLVGPFPRYLADFDKFEVRVQAVLKEVKDMAATTQRLGIANLMEGKVPTESGKINVTHVVAKQLSRKPWASRMGFRHDMMPLALYFAAQQSRRDLAAAAAIVGASSSGEFFERFVATRALELGWSGGFPVSEYEEPPGGDNAQSRKLVCADGKYKDEAYAEERKLNLNLKRTGNIDDGIEALVDLIEDRKTLLWMPTGSFPVADFAFSKQHVINAKVGKELEMKCSTLMKFHERVHGEGSMKDKVTLDLLLPEGTEPRGLTLKGDKAARQEVLRHFELRFVTIPKALMGRAFDETVAGALGHYGCFPTGEGCWITK